MRLLALLLIAVALTCVVAAVAALPVMWLWNAALVGTITGVNAIGYFQAVGITLLAGILTNINVKVNPKD